MRWRVRFVCDGQREVQGDFGIRLPFPTDLSAWTSGELDAEAYERVEAFLRRVRFFPSSVSEPRDFYQRWRVGFVWSPLHGTLFVRLQGCAGLKTFRGRRLVSFHAPRSLTRALLGVASSTLLIWQGPRLARLVRKPPVPAPATPLVPQETLVRAGRAQTEKDVVAMLKQSAAQTEFERLLVEEDKAGEALMARRIALLKDCYCPGFAPPAWSEQPSLWPRFNDARVFYHAHEDLRVVQALVMGREPVNIMRHKHFREDVMRANWGWTTGFYDNYFTTTNSLAPNIAVYTPTTVTNGLTTIHVLNCIGFALDHKEQSDYRYFIGEAGELTPAKRDAMKTRYGAMLRLIRAAMQHCHAPCVVMSLVGGESFATLYPPSAKYRGKPNAHLAAWTDEIFVPAFKDVFHALARANRVFLMGGSDHPATARLAELGYMIENIGRFPDDVTKFRKVAEALFVNAWDPLSVPGNGNGRDRSLDGFVGRNTYIGYAGNAMTNPHLLFNLVPVDA